MHFFQRIWLQGATQPESFLSRPFQFVGWHLKVDEQMTFYLWRIVFPVIEQSTVTVARFFYISCPGFCHVHLLNWLGTKCHLIINIKTYYILYMNLYTPNMALSSRRLCRMRLSEIMNPVSTQGQCTLNMYTIHCILPNVANISSILA
jgi:hypothetical protein